MGPLSQCRLTASRVLPVCLSIVLLAVLLPGALLAQSELSYRQYRDLAALADRFEHVAQFEPLQGEPGMFFAIAERFGTVQVLKADGRGVRTVWKSNQLAGIPEEVIVADLSGDGLDDALFRYSRTRRAHLGWYQFVTRWLTPFFQSDLTPLGLVRDSLFGLACKLPIVRSEMVAMMSGLSLGPFRRMHLHSRPPRLGP